MKSRQVDVVCQSAIISSSYGRLHRALSQVLQACVTVQVSKACIRDDYRRFCFKAVSSNLPQTVRTYTPSLRTSNFQVNSLLTNTRSVSSLYKCVFSDICNAVTGKISVD